MTWARFDEDFPEHPKLAHVGPLGLALQVRAVCYSNRNSTDGFIPEREARRMVADMPEGELVLLMMLDVAPRQRRSLWSRVEGGYHVTGIEDYQPTRAEVEGKATSKQSGRTIGGRIRAGTAEREKGRFVSARDPASLNAGTSNASPASQLPPAAGSDPGSDPDRSTRLVAHGSARAPEPPPDLDDLPPPASEDPRDGLGLPPADFASLPVADSLTPVLEQLEPIRRAAGCAWSQADLETTKALLRTLMAFPDVPMPVRAVRIFRAFHVDDWARSEGFPLRALPRQWSVFDRKGADMDLAVTHDGMRKLGKAGSATAEAARRVAERMESGRE